MRFAISAMFALSTQAFAASPIDKLYGSIGAVSMETDRVDVPLYSAPSGYPYSSVQVTIGEHSYLFKLHTGSEGLYVGPRVVKDQKLKVRVGNKKLINLQGKDNKFKVGGEWKYADLGEMQIGGLSLHDVVVSTKDPNAPYKVIDYYADYDSNLDFDGVIGLAALPSEISWAIRPSAGQVSFARGEAVSGLATGGTTAPFTAMKSFKYRYGKVIRIASGAPLVVDVEIGGVTRPTRLMSAIIGNHYYAEESAPAALNNRYGDIYYRYHDASLGGISLGTAWFAEYTALSQSPERSYAFLGSRVLHRYDIAVDRGASTLTLKEATDGVWNDPLAFMIAEALKAVQPEETEEAASDEEPVSGEETEATTDSEAAAAGAPADVNLLEEGSDGEATKPVSADDPPGGAAEWKYLKELYVSQGDLDSSIDAMQNVLAFDERDCVAWMDLGELQVRTGDFVSAISSFEKASAVYHAWYDFPLEEREELQKAYDKLDADEKESSEHHPADSHCHAADTSLAEATFSAGDLLTVEQLYRDRFDLDSRLALIAANALITKGDFAGAQAPLRQALKKGGTKSWTRLALAIVYANSGDWDQASLLFERALHHHRQTQSVKVWLDALAAVQGADAAHAAAKEMAMQHPLSLASQYGVAYALRDSKDDTVRSTAQEQGETLFVGSLKETPREGSKWAVYARWLNLWGETEKAEAAAQKALDLSPGRAVTYIALAEVHSANGEAEKAKEYTLKAAQTMPLHPGYAQLINTLSE